MARTIRYAVRMRALVLILSLGSACTDANVPEPEPAGSANGSPRVLIDRVTDATGLERVPLRVYVSDEDDWEAMHIQVWINSEPLCDEPMNGMPHMCWFDAPVDGGRFLVDAAVQDSARAIGEAQMVLDVLPALGPTTAWAPVRSVPFEDLDALVLTTEGEAERLVVWSSLDGVVYDGEPVNTWVPEALSVGTHHLMATVIEGRVVDADERTVEVLRANEPPDAPVVVGLPATTGRRSLVARVETLPADPDGDGVVLSWSWDNGTEQLDRARLPVSAQAVGDVWTVTVTATDALGAAASTETEVRIVNSAPRIDAVTIEVDGDDWLCRASVADADGDVLTVHHRWLDDGVAVLGVGERLPRGAVPAICEVTVADSSEVRVRTARVSPGNQPPQGQPVLPSAVTSGDVIGVRAPFSDAEFATLTSSYRWFVDGIEVDVDEAYLPAGTARSGQAVRVEVTVSDGIDETTANSNIITVGNRPPEAPAIRVDAGDVDTDMHCVIESEGRDLDGDPVSYRFSWNLPEPWTNLHANDGVSTLGSWIPRAVCTVEADDGWDVSSTEASRASHGCDVDGDGYGAEHCGGLDCDDNDRQVHPDQLEGDKDCDGLDCPVFSFVDRRWVVCSDLLPFEDAAAACEQGGQTLVELPDVEALVRLSEVTFSTGIASVWLGLEPTGDDWQWRSGLPLLWHRWLDEPGDHTGAQWSSAGWTRSDAQAAFVCERRP